MDIASTIFAVPMIVIIAILVFWGCFCKVTSFFDERSYLKKGYGEAIVLMKKFIGKDA